MWVKHPSKKGFLKSCFPVKIRQHSQQELTILLTSITVLRREPYVKGEPQWVMAYGISKNWRQQNILILVVVNSTAKFN